MSESYNASPLDQLRAYLVDLGAAVGGYYEALVKAGISQDIAEHLVLDWHHSFLAEDEEDVRIESGATEEDEE